VQLAISQKKLLGYLNGTVVPYSRSQSMVKEKNAECQRPCSSAARGKGTVATWDMMRGCLQTLLGNLGAGEQTLPLSNIKRLFRAQFHIELSETALGYAKLSELLQDSRLQDLCEVKLRGHGYVIVPIKKSAARSLISLSDSLCMEAQGPSPPKSTKSCDSLRLRAAGVAAALSVSEVVSPDSSPKQAGEIGAAPSHAPCVATPARSPFPPTPSPNSMATYARSLPRLLGSIRTGPQALFGDALKAPSRAAASTAAVVTVASPPAKVITVASPPAKARLNPGTPLRIVRTAASPLSGSAGREQVTPACQKEMESQPWRLNPLTPCTLGKFGFSVHNTFIHAAMSPPTPMQLGAHHRARSVPRDAY